MICWMFFKVQLQISYQQVFLVWFIITIIIDNFHKFCDTIKLRTSFMNNIPKKGDEDSNKKLDEAIEKGIFSLHEKK